MAADSGFSKGGLRAFLTGLRKPTADSGIRLTEESFVLLALQDLVLFPDTMIPVLLAVNSAKEAVEQALKRDRRLFAACIRHIHPQTGEETWGVGTVVRIVQHPKLPDGNLRVVLEGEYRATLLGGEDGLVRVAPIDSGEFGGPEDLALLRSVQESFVRYAELSRKIGSDTLLAVKNGENPERTANLICNASLLKSERKVELLAVPGSRERLRAVLEMLEGENQIFGIQKNISGKVRDRLEKGNRERYLNEQLREIRRELDGEDEKDEFEDLGQRIALRKPPLEVTERAGEELARLRKLQTFSPEAGVLRAYLQWIADLPWSEASEDLADLALAEKVLDEDHFGMRGAKDRILEFIAIRHLLSGRVPGEDSKADAVKGPILCFVGPPGTGKTSLGKSVARALGRRFVRFSLGGLRDEAEIRGHRKTYVGALPGRIIQSMRKAGTVNPVLLLDEIDKLSSDVRGDPASALLEVLDPEQNSGFTDHYLEVPYDLSGVLFIATANSLHGIPHPLLDRMEIIEIPGYGENEKLAIARRFLLPKELLENGLSEAGIRFGDDALRAIIRHWTMEAGVRSLQREIARCARRMARTAVARGYGLPEKSIADFARTIRPANLEKLLGRRKFNRDLALGEAKVGVSCALAWTESGGMILQVESTVCKGRGELLITGNLGDVMKESARIALSYLGSVEGDYPVLPRDGEANDFHIHVPAGAIPKDGPSAGVAIAVSLLSTLCRRPPNPGIAMTGELTLTGRILPVGGLKEKLLAAIRGGIVKVVLPTDNRGDWEELDKEIREALQVEFADNASATFALLFGFGCEG